MKRLKSAIFIVVSASMALTGIAAEPIHWGYSGKVGPEHWSDLDPKYFLCGSGQNQSPIDLSNLIEADLKPIQFAYEAGTAQVLNNGHTIQVNYAPGHSITVEGHTFELKQFHFHSPSENTINGKQFPLEGHLVHADQNGNLAVVAVMYEEGPSNPALGRLWKAMPKLTNEKKGLPDKQNVLGILPKGRDYYRFNGSLTTPPCSEGVWWLVLKESVSVSKAQIEEFTRMMHHHPNNRPVQPANARPILE